MVLIFAQLPSTPTAAVSRWQGVTVEWIGWDGSVWDLANGPQGVILLKDGVEGLHFPRIEKFRSRSRVVAGARLRGSRALEREVFWPIMVHSLYSSNEFVERADAFFRTIDEEKPGRWRVGVNGQFRELSLTGVFEDSHSESIDPVHAGIGIYKVTLEAVQPYWSGELVERGPWSAPAPVDFIDAEGSPPFHISSSAAFGSAFIPNPGDVPSYPVWEVRGPLDEIELGVDGRVIEVPFAVADGEVLLIDTDPRNVTATLDGVDVTEDLGFQSFAPVQPSERADLHVEATGAGNVRVSLTPLYKRAY